MSNNFNMDEQNGESEWWVKEFTKIVNSHEQTEKKNPGDNLLSQLCRKTITLCVYVCTFSILTLLVFLKRQPPQDDGITD